MTFAIQLCLHRTLRSVDGFASDRLHFNHDILQFMILDLQKPEYVFLGRNLARPASCEKNLEKPPLKSIIDARSCFKARWPAVDTLVQRGVPPRLISSASTMTILRSRLIPRMMIGAPKGSRSLPEPSEERLGVHWACSGPPEFR